MADPVLVECSKGSWTKVVTGKVTGFLRKSLFGAEFSYFWTSRDTGNPAPSNADYTDGGLAQPLFETERSERITSIVEQDFYVWITRTIGPETTVNVRVDL